MADYNYDTADVRKAGAAGAGKGALGGAAAGTAILPGIGTAIGAGVGLIGGAIMATRTEKAQQEADADAEAMAKAEQANAERSAKLAEASYKQSMRRGGVTEPGDQVLLDASGAGSQYDTWRAATFGT